MGDVHADDQGKQHDVADLKLQDHLSWGVQKRGTGAAGGGPVLSRSCSTASHRLGRTVSSTALRRTFSMRKSQSVREGGYRRIHDNISNSSGGEAAAAAGDHENGGDAEEAAASTSAPEDVQVKDSTVKKKRKSRFRRACKKFFGF